MAPIAQDAVSRGYMSSSGYLIDIEAGFELWQGGAGLAASPTGSGRAVRPFPGTVNVHGSSALE